MPSTAELVLRLLVAGALGGLVGLEREVTGHAAGLRTHISVALGSALFVMAGAYGMEEFFQHRATTNVQVSVDRVASTVVTGVGFLGGGAIVKYGASVRGLTTAASLWVTAAIGLAVALGSYTIALAATTVLVVALAGLRVPERWVTRQVAGHVQHVLITLQPDADPMPVVAALGDAEGIAVRSVEIRYAADGCTVDAAIVQTGGRDLEDRLAPLAAREDVEDVDIL
jgi:putative Mg2+ transporter-C (MgtC) family protein